MTQPKIPNGMPSVVETGQVLATVNDWRAILIVAMFLLVAITVFMMGFIVWREASLRGLTKAIDKMADALWAVRLSIAVDRGRDEIPPRDQQP